MIHETERYARQSGNNSFETSVEEMKTYLGILFLPGILPVGYHPSHQDGE
jgi:hypothetical protein